MSGTLSVYLEEDKSYKYIKVVLQGQSHVYWEERHTDSSGDSRTRRYTSDETCADGTILLWSNQQTPNATLAPGSYDYQFRFILPPNCPQSFEGEHGHIRYFVRGHVGTGLHDHSIEAPI